MSRSWSQRGRLRDGAGIPAADRDAADEQGVGGHAEGENLPAGGLANRQPEAIQGAPDRRVVGRVQSPTPGRGDQGPGKRRDAPGDFR
jgi:hypothetical protein